MRIQLVLFTLILSSVLLIAGCGGEENADSSDQIRVGGAANTTFAYGFLSSWSETLESENEALDFVIQATPGSSVHYEMIEEDQIDLGAGFAPNEYMALQGEREPFTDMDFSKFRILFPMTVSRAHVVTTKNSNLETVHDLEGKRLGVPGRGSASTVTTEDQLKALGVEAEFVYAQPDEIRNMLQDGRVDAFWHYVGAPYSGILDLESQIDLKFISFTEEDINKIAEVEPYTDIGNVTSEHYDFVEEDVTTPITYPTVIVNSDVDEDTVYEITKTTWENWDKIAELTPAAEQVTIEDTAKLIGTIHPGALRYYEEEGIAIPEELK
ncbi:TAXI family TRAP transporter solute-binding subunit [Oceanobacillus jeddahense]|uniref:TAXI family TRAP transporter solute-binding subunit n=1 Tax=Oceanobacillus jeddahense TaxID=1462527 RepID=A0ABY5JQB1_9BACI|nr:TAXI family TRAP transporter solute-binding subunit [Oceanobacillus jeddahense]UUI02475.1 TAXI family TRAP transporter solute-binding subunit [Oceanobacillus jeddahense]